MKVTGFLSSLAFAAVIGQVAAVPAKSTDDGLVSGLREALEKNGGGVAGGLKEALDKALPDAAEKGDKIAGDVALNAIAAAVAKVDLEAPTTKLQMKIQLDKVLKQIKNAIPEILESLPSGGSKKDKDEKR